MKLEQIVETIGNHARSEMADYPAFIIDDTVITYRQFISISDSILEQLIDNNFQGKVVALSIKNPLIHFGFYYSCLRAKICHLSLDSNASYDQQLSEIKLFNANIVIKDHSMNLNVSTAFIVDQNFQLKQVFQGKEVAPNSQYQGYAYLLKGSGTTASPKLIGITRNSLAAQVDRDFELFSFKPLDRFYTWTAINFNTPKRRTLSALYNRLTVYLPRQKPENLLLFLSQRSIEHLALTTNQARLLVANIQSGEILEAPLFPTIKTLMVSSSVVYMGLRQKLMKWVSPNLFIGYGCNELGELTKATPEEVKQYPNTIGSPLSGVDIKVVNKGGGLCEVGQPGQIMIKKDFLKSIYIDNPGLNEELVKQGYFIPNDVGYFNKDGLLFYKSRSDDLIIFQGVNIYPAEVEEVLISHPAIEEAAVFPLITNEGEQVPFSFVTLSQPDLRISEYDILVWSRAKLGIKHPKRVFICEELKKTEAGKVIKRDLAKLALKMLPKRVKEFR